jgi:hypothetical protein
MRDAEAGAAKSGSGVGPLGRARELAGREEQGQKGCEWSGKF